MTAAGARVKAAEIRHLMRDPVPDDPPPENGDAEARADRRLVLTPASQIKPRPVLWGWEDRMPAGHLSLIPGREGIGKSLFLVWLAAQITRGTLPGAYYGSPRAVFYCAAEDSWQHTIVPRLIAAHADLDLVYRIDVESVEETPERACSLSSRCRAIATCWPPRSSALRLPWSRSIP